MGNRSDARKVALAELIADRIAAAYNRNIANAARLADVADEVTDRSGNLLGWIREYADIRRRESGSATGKGTTDGA